MLRLSLVSAIAIASAAQASVISTSVFPNSACAGASSSSLGGLVGVGRVVLSNGEVETHCGCPSDNLPSFEACPSSDNGEAVCNSVLDLESGAFTASCGVVACQGSECPSTVVNTVVVDEADCAAKGAIGISSVDGEDKCACSAEDGEFSPCPAVENGRPSCVATDNDFLGMAYTHKETVKCGIVCDDGYFLTPAGTCATLAKRAFHSPRPIKVGPSMSHSRSHGPSHTGPSVHFPSHTPHHTKPHHGGSTTKPHNPHHTTKPGHHGSSTRKVHHSTTPSEHSSSSSHTRKVHHSTSTTTSDVHVPTGPTKVGPSPSHGPSQVAHARRAAEEIVFADVCAQDERSCPAGDFGDFSCVRLDDVTECGGCNSLGDAVSCLNIPGVASAACLRGGCVVRACQTGYVQTSEGTCSPK